MKSVSHLRENLGTIVSNTAFFIPFFVAMQKGYTTLSFLILGIAIISSLYHIAKKPGSDFWWLSRNRTAAQLTLLILDTALSLGIVIYTFSLANHRFITPSSAWYGLLVFIIGLGLLFLPRGNYEWKHSLWHICAAIALALAL